MYFDCYSKSSPARPNFDFVENRDRPMFGKRKPGPPDVRQKKPETARNPKKQVFEHHYFVQSVSQGPYCIFRTIEERA